MKRHKMKNSIIIVFLLVLVSSCKTIKTNEIKAEANGNTIKLNNPIIKDKYTADPAALVYKDKVYL